LRPIWPIALLRLDNRSIGQASRLLAWRPEVAPFDGFERTVDWYKHNQDWLARAIV
jgi:dTDP-D-glucose 4,6-dehydratase